MKKFTHLFFLFSFTFSLHATNTFQEKFSAAVRHAQQHEFERALEIQKELVATHPNNPSVLYNTAHILLRMGRMQEALPFYEKTIALRPENGQAHLGYAKTCLATGNFTTGWQAFEHRMADYNTYKQQFQFHHLTPKNIFGKTVLVRSEWGLGDMMQFIRYTKLLKKCGAKKIIVSAFSPLVDLFSLCDSIDEVVSTKSEIVPAHDVQIPTLSLPLFFNTQVDTIPCTIPYLHADPKLVTFWQKKLQAVEQNKKPFRVGLCWQAKPDIFLEKNPLTRRSIPLKLFAPLADVTGVKFYSLQRQFGEEQLADLPDGFVVHDFGPDFDTTHGRFMDTAAVIQNLDLIISVDTAIVHLAGGLGAKVLVLLPSVAEWRWHLEKNTTPWYPNVLLFRQKKQGQWREVIQEIKKHLIQTCG